MMLPPPCFKVGMVFLGDVQSVAPMGRYALPIMSRNALDKSVDGFLVGSSKDLDQAIRKLLDCLWQYLTVLDARTILNVL